MAIKDLKDNLKRLKDADPVELASQVNAWLQESGEALRLRIEDEVEKAVTKRGFVKKSEFQKLEARIVALEGRSSKSNSDSKRVGAKRRDSAKPASSAKSRKKNLKPKPKKGKS